MGGGGWTGGEVGGGKREMPVVGVHDSFLKNSSQKKKAGSGGSGLLK